MCHWAQTRVKKDDIKLDTYLVIGGRGGVGVVPRVHATTAASIAGAAQSTWATAPIARAVVVVTEVGLGIALVYHQVNRHLALQTTDVTLTEVVAEFMYLCVTHVSHLIYLLNSSTARQSSQHLC